MSGQGDRTSPHRGETALVAPGSIKFSDWELQGPGCYEETIGLPLRCSKWDYERSCTLFVSIHQAPTSCTYHDDS